MLKLLQESLKKKLQNGKNLLAFSAGVDSSALFFILLQEGVNFDIAIVDFCTRESSKLEVSYAIELANKHNKRCFTKRVRLDKVDFEQSARVARYSFFEQLIESHGYQNLITAHQLNDRLEWFLMQLTRGAGVVEMFGMHECEKRSNYSLIRPLLQHTKDDLLNYLKKEQIHYFEDESNLDESFRRNWIRHNVSQKLLEQDANGILRSFKLLGEDRESLLADEPLHGSLDGCLWIEPHDNLRSVVDIVDKYLKQNGVLLSYGERELLKSSDEVSISREFVVSFGKKITIVTPKSSAVMSHRFKEQCRVLGIGRLVRPWLSQNIEVLQEISVIVEQIDCD